jgi:Carboxypeptidase regulatory-like domain
MHLIHAVFTSFKRCARTTTFGLSMIALLTMAGPYAHAQVTAVVSGTVTDATGALVQGASVTVIDEATQVARSAQTNKSGVFAVPDLNPDTYTVKVAAKGFTPKELTGIDVHAGDEIKLPTFVLAIGAVTDTVTVTSVAGQILTTENGQRSETLTYLDIQDLALTGRDTTELLKVLPGVVQVGNNGYNALSTTTGNSAIGNGMGINGAPYKGGTAINMDGASILDIGDDFSGLATVNPEMTQEVQVLTSAFGADTANGPNVINTTGKSGGEHYHGEGWFDVRNDVLNANDWQDNHTTPIHPKGGASYYYPGGSISGPVPRTNKKVFFYGGFELPFQNQGNANILRLSIPTPEMLKGNFSMDNPDNQVLCPFGFQNSLGSPVTSNGLTYTQGAWCQNIAQTNGNTTWTILPDGSIPSAMAGTTSSGFSNGGYVPSAYIDQNMLAFTKVWPAWNSPYIATTTQQIINNGGFNYYQPIINHDNGWVARGRIDYNPNSTNLFYISYQQSYDSQLAGSCGQSFYASTCANNNLQYPGGGLTKQTFSKILNGHYVHIFSPTLTNEALASWVWGNIPILPGTNSSANFRTTLGANIGCVYCANPKYMPTFGGVQNAYPGVAEPDYWEPGNYYIVQKSVPTFADNLTKIWGNHTLKFGGLASNTDNYQGNQSTNLQGALSIGGSPWGSTPNFNYFARQGTCAAGVCGSYGGVTGQNIGSNNTTVNFLTGNLTNYSESNSSPLSDVAYQTLAFYANDQVRVNKQLSVEVGLRFEHIGWWYDRQGTGLAVFYANRVLPDFYAGKYAPGFYWHGIDASLPLSGRSDRFGFVSPRFGLSYDVFGNSRTLVRGGWGAYRYQEAANGPQAALNTAQGVQNFSASTVTSTLSGSTFLLSQIGQLATLAPKCQVQCAQNGQTGYDPNDHGIPLTYSYNFTIDQQLPWHMLLDVAYVGNHAMHMADNGQDGVATGNYANQNKTPLYAYGKLVGGQWMGNVDTFTQKTICNPENLNATCSSGSGAADFQPFGRGISCTNPSNPNCTIYGTASVNMIQHNNYQNYNALQVALEKRSGPLTVNANFTWSKSLGTVVNWNPFVIAANNTYDNLNRPFVFNASYIYRMPDFFHGNRFLAEAINGWTISGITLWQDGVSTLPTINIQYDPNSLPTGSNPQSLTVNTRGVGASTFFGTNAGMVTGRPQLTCDPKAGLVKYQLYRPCFTVAPFGSSGGFGLPFIAGQAYMENDLAISKTFSIHERNKIKFTASAFNWLNHPLPTFGSGESTTEYYFYNYTTHAITVNDTCASLSSTPGCATTSVAPGSGNPGSPIVASNTYGNANGQPANLFGTQHFKQGFGGNNQRIMEFELKYSF